MASVCVYSSRARWNALRIRVSRFKMLRCSLMLSEVHKSSNVFYQHIFEIMPCES